MTKIDLAFLGLFLPHFDVIYDILERLWRSNRFSGVEKHRKTEEPDFQRFARANNGREREPKERKKGEGEEIPAFIQ